MQTESGLARLRRIVRETTICPSCGGSYGVFVYANGKKSCIDCLINPPIKNQKDRDRQLLKGLGLL